MNDTSRGTPVTLIFSDVSSEPTLASQRTDPHLGQPFPSHLLLHPLSRQAAPPGPAPRRPPSFLSSPSRLCRQNPAFSELTALPPPTTAALSPPPGRPGLLRVQPGGGQQGARGSATVTGMPKGRTGSHSASMGQAPACQKAPEAECHRAKRRPCLCPHSLRQLRGDGPRLRASVSSLTSTRTAGLP